jgi:SH3-like domain-containing protein
MPDEIPTMQEIDERIAARRKTDLDWLLLEQGHAVTVARELRRQLAEAEAAVEWANLTLLVALVGAVEGLERRP